MGEQRKRLNLPFIVTAVILLIVLIIFGIFLISSSSGKNKEYEDKISDYKHRLEEIKKENDSLKEQNESLLQEIELKKSGQAETGVCYLTFDDGPSENTPQILDILKQYDVKATFFVIGAGKREYLKRIVDEGHSVGLHSLSHRYESVYASPDAFYQDLAGIADIVKQETGVDSKVIRFPGGASNTVSKKYCQGIMSTIIPKVEEMGYAYFDWNVSSGDASKATPDPEFIKNNVLANSQGKDNICVLMHDAAPKTTTVEALPGIIEGLKQMGFTKFKGLKKSSPVFHQGIAN